MTYWLPPLAYGYGALKPYYDERLLRLHHSRHHMAYVAGLNTTLDRLHEARSKRDFDSIVGLEKSLAFNLSGHMLHSLFWKNLSPTGGGKPDGELASAIEHFFGSFDRFRDHLTEATARIQGSGWGALAWEPIAKRLVVEQIYDHQGNIGSGSLPLLVIDAWEHAYYLQYENLRHNYIDALWHVIDWKDVQARFERCRTYSVV